MICSSSEQAFSHGDGGEIIRDVLSVHEPFVFGAGGDLVEKLGSYLESGPSETASEAVPDMAIAPNAWKVTLSETEGPFFILF